MGHATTAVASRATKAGAIRVGRAVANRVTKVAAVRAKVRSTRSAMVDGTSAVKDATAASRVAMAHAVQAGTALPDASAARGTTSYVRVRGCGAPAWVPGAGAARSVRRRSSWICCGSCSS